MSNVSKEDCWIRTYRGHEFNFVNIDPATIDIQDIAHSLSLICRFTGHLREFYSVAEHCIWVSNLAYKYALAGVTPLYAPVPSQREAAKIGLLALMHDASEAYITDLNSPAKSLLPGYKALENLITDVINKKYGIEFGVVPAQIKYADNTMLIAEAKALLFETDFTDWINNVYDKKVQYNQIPLTPRQAESSFLNRYATMMQMYTQPEPKKVVDMQEFKDKKATSISEKIADEAVKEAIEGAPRGEKDAD